MRIAALALLLVLVAACSNSGQPNAQTSTAGTPTAPATSASPAPTSAATPPVIPEQTITGNGTDIAVLNPPVQLAIMSLDCSKCTKQLVVKSDANIDRDLVGQLSDGKYTGKRWLGIRGGTVSRIQVNTTGPWTIRISDLSTVRQLDATTPATGNGDDVVLYRVGPKSAAITHKDSTGYNHFAVQVAMDGLVSPELVVNQIGSFDGTVMLPGNGTNAALVQISARGPWTIAPK